MFVETVLRLSSSNILFGGGVEAMDTRTGFFGHLCNVFVNCARSARQSVEIFARRSVEKYLLVVLVRPLSRTIVLG